MSSDDGRFDALRPIAEVDRTIHEPSRLLIMSLLYVVERADFLFLEKQTGLTRGNMSSHIAKLEKAGYVKVEKTFVDRVPRTLYRLEDVGREEFDAYRETALKALGSDLTRVTADEAPDADS